MRRPAHLIPVALVVASAARAQDPGVSLKASDQDTWRMFTTSKQKAGAG